jgi:hypothetical protein
VTATGNITANNAITANNDIRSNNGWVITGGSKGWMNETYGGGFYMSDSQWVRSVNNKGIYTGGQVRGGSVRSDGDVSAGGILSLDQVNTAGASCSVTGAISRDASGSILSCQSGAWTKPASGKPGYYCRRTSFDKGRSDDYVGYTPRTDDDCPVLSPGQAPQGYCSCIKIMLDY